MLSAETLRRTLFILTPWLSRIASLIVVVILVGLMPDIAGIAPSQSILRARAGQQHLLTPEALAAVRADLQLDRSASERLIDWIGSAFSGDLGNSWIDGSSVALGIQKTAATSLFLMSSALVMTFVLCGAGLLATLRRWKQGKLGQSYSSLSTV